MREFLKIKEFLLYENEMEAGEEHLERNLKFKYDNEQRNRRERNE